MRREWELDEADERHGFTFFASDKPRGGIGSHGIGLVSAQVEVDRRELVALGSLKGLVEVSFGFENLMDCCGADDTEFRCVG